MTMTRTPLEDQTRTPASTAMPETTRQQWQRTPPGGLYGPVKTYVTHRPCVLLLDREPAREDWCRAPGWSLPCNRRTGHRGRHAWTLYARGGRIRAVWGARAQTGETS